MARDNEKSNSAMRIDFHVHSTASDGSFPPAGLAAEGKDFFAMALTDHDNTDGIAEYLSAKIPTALRRIAGVELSIEPGEGFDKFHLLALGIDVSNAALKAFLRRILDGRNGRNDRIIANFARLGIEMPDIETYANGEVLARPHFAKYLFDHGYAKTPKEAFDKYLLPDSPRETRCYEERYHPPQEETFRIVHAAGGIAVMAHPKYWRLEWKTSGIDYKAAEKELARLKEAGLDGLECHYRANDVDEDVKFTNIATALGLLKTAGSDFHGANKPNIPLGMEVSEAFIRPTLDRLGVN